MYQPHHFRIDDPKRQVQLIRSYPLGTLISHGADGLNANPLPFVIDPAPDSLGLLRCHLAKANDQWRELEVNPDCLIVFQGPDAYVTPAWYGAKAETGKVVPTWNYATVHVWGRARVIHDAEWLQQQIRDLTSQHEAGQAQPWAVTDAPESYIAAQVRGIVGLEVDVLRAAGKWKMSQNRPAADRSRVADGLRAQGSAAAELIDTKSD